MSSPFAAAMAAAAATHDSVMAEDFEYRPMKSADNRNAPSIPDPDREIKEFRAPWVDAAARFHSDSARVPGVTSQHPGHASTRPSVALDLSRLPYEPAPKDQIFRKATSLTYHVAEIVPSAPGFARLDLNRI